VWVFCYGSFINRQVLARGGLVPDRVEVARLWGFDILTETLATLVSSDRRRHATGKSRHAISAEG
jgi:hypothetical protein